MLATLLADGGVTTPDEFLLPAVTDGHYRLVEPLHEFPGQGLLAQHEKVGVSWIAMVWGRPHPTALSLQTPGRGQTIPEKTVYPPKQQLAIVLHIVDLAHLVAVSLQNLGDFRP